MNIPLKNSLHSIKPFLFFVYGYIVLDNTYDNSLEYGFIRNVVQVDSFKKGLKTICAPTEASAACALQILFWFVLDLPKMRHELGVAVPHCFRRIPLALEMPSQAGD